MVFASKKSASIICIQLELFILLPRYCCKKTYVEDEKYFEHDIFRETTYVQNQYSE